MTLRDITDLHVEAKAKEFPNYPKQYIVRKAFRDKTSGQLQLSIEAFVTLTGGYARRRANTGRYRPGKEVVDVVGRTRIMKGTWLGGLENGVADVMCVYQGITVAVEVKIGRDTQKEDQKIFQANYTKAGGKYLIVTSWDDFYAQWVKTIPKKFHKYFQRS